MSSSSNTAAMPASQQYLDTVIQKTTGILPGISGGVARVLVGQPFDIIKTRLQVLAKGSVGAIGMPESIVYSNSMDCVRKMVLHEGPMSLYAGTMAPLLANMVLLGVHFPTFNKVTAELKAMRGTNEINYLDTWVAGGAAGIAGSLISSPAELVRTRMTMMRKAAIVAAAKGPGAAPSGEDFTGSWDCFKKVAKRHGVVGLYKGYAPTLIRDIQGYGWFFLAYEATVHAMLEPGQSRDQLSFNQIVTAGIMAGFGLWGSMFPIDTIKSKIQSDSFTEPAYKGMADAYKQTVKSEGMAGLFRGYWAAMGRAIPVNAAIFLAVEGMKDLLASDALQGLTQAQPAKL